MSMTKGGEAGILVTNHTKRIGWISEVISLEIDRFELHQLIKLNLSLNAALER